MINDPAQYQENHKFYYDDKIAINIISVTWYHKVPENLDTRKICCNRSKFQTKYCHSVMRPGDAEGIANRVCPDQTALLIWVCTVCPDLYIRRLRISTVRLNRG